MNLQAQEVQAQVAHNQVDQVRIVQVAHHQACQAQRVQVLNQVAQVHLVHQAQVHRVQVHLHSLMHQGLTFGIMLLIRKEDRFRMQR